jgi:hypothetical protein
MASSKLSDLTELAAQPAASDELYVNDGGVSKKITYTNLLGAALQDLVDLGVVASDGQFIVGTGSGALAYESGATAVTSLGILALVQSWTKAQRSTFVELTDAGPVVVDLALSNNFFVTVTADREIGDPSNKVNGQSGFFMVEQNATGGWNTTFHANWDFGPAGTPAPNTAANKKMLIAYLVDWDAAKVMARHIEDF